MLFCLLLLPLILGALFFESIYWFFMRPHYFLCLLLSLFLGAGKFFLPIYLLPAFLRYFLKKTLSFIEKIAISIVIFFVWLWIVLLYGDELFRLGLLKEWLARHTVAPLNGYLLFFALSIVLLSTFMMCFVILGYRKSGNLNTWRRIDYALCMIICVVYFVFGRFFIAEGGLIYFFPCSETYIVANDFPKEKLANLRALFRFVSINESKLKNFFSKKEISYEDFLAMTATSPAILSKNPPKFYFRYWIDEILYPLSDDLAQKSYWGRKWITSSEQIEDYYIHGRDEIERDVFLASKYLSLLAWSAAGAPQEAYNQLLREREMAMFHLPGVYTPLPMTPKEESEWLIWYGRILQDFH
jgi:hypothetical protein